MKTGNSKHEMDMCKGAIFPKLMSFSLPIIFSAILQLLFNTADMVVVGKFGQSGSLAAVGSTGSLTNLFVNFFIGLSIGTGVLTARCFGAKNSEDCHKVVHTSVAVSIISGVFIMFAGIILAPFLLRLMDCPEDIINKSILYMRIYFIGMPALMLYNFASSILRAVGDSKRPLLYITIAGIINVVLNLIFVILFKLDIAGVAIATVISQIISAILTTKALINSDNMIKLEINKIKIYKKQLKQLSVIGVPSGLQSCMFSISNVTIQSAINSFGSSVIGGSAAAQSIEGYVYAVMHSIAQSALNFAGQNFGAKNYKRIHLIFAESVIIVVVLGFTIGNLATMWGSLLAGLFTNNSAEIAAGVERLSVVCKWYWLCGIMDVTTFILRGIGCSFPPMIMSIGGVCGIRIAWIYTYFVFHPTLFSLLLSYPVSWIVVIIAEFILYLYFTKKHFKNTPQIYTT